MLEGLKRRWDLSTDRQLLIILIGFAVTGSSTAWLARRVMPLTWEEAGLGYVLARLLLITVIYPFVLVTVGTLLGQRRFFTHFLWRMVGRRPKKPSDQNVPL